MRPNQKKFQTVKDNQMGTAESLGRFFKMNPEAIYDWSKKHNVNLLMNAHKWMGNYNGDFVDAVLEDAPLKEAMRDTYLGLFEEPDIFADSEYGDSLTSEKPEDTPNDRKIQVGDLVQIRYDVRSRGKDKAKKYKVLVPYYSKRGDKALLLNLETGDKASIDRDYLLIVENKKEVKEMREQKRQQKRQLKEWKGKVQDTYSSLEELEDYDEVYGILNRVNKVGKKYDTLEDLWNANPNLKGSTDPDDFGLSEASLNLFNEKGEYTGIPKSFLREEESNITEFDFPEGDYKQLPNVKGIKFAIDIQDADLMRALEMDSNLVVVVYKMNDVIQYAAIEEGFNPGNIDKWEEIELSEI